MKFIDTYELKTRELTKGFYGRFIHTEHNTIGYIRVDAGAVLPEHAHVHEQVTTIIEGQFEVTLGGEAKVLGPGMAFHAVPNMPHSARAITDCFLIDLFHPVREDFK